VKYMLVVCADPSIEWTPADHAYVEKSMVAWLADTIGRGVNLHGGQLQPTSAATTVRIRDDEVLLTDGPFAETKELMAGYDVISCANLDEAIEVAGRHPMARYGAIEVRPFIDEHQANPRQPSPTRE